MAQAGNCRSAVCGWYLHSFGQAAFERASVDLVNSYDWKNWVQDVFWMKFGHFFLISIPATIITPHR